MSETLNIAKELISKKSITPEDAGCQDLMIQRLEKLGFEIENMPHGDVKNFYAKKGTRSPLIVFAGHTDVVPPGPLEKWVSPPFEPTIKDGYLYGRGSEDMKGCTAASMVSVFKFIKENKDFNGTISFIITGDEEADSVNGVKKVVKWLKENNIRIDGSIATESSSEKLIGDQIKVGRKGAVDVQIEIIGKQGHAAYPQLAQNPLHCMSKLISFFDDQKLDDGAEYFEPSTLQFTQINLNNKAKNVIPEKLITVGDMRFNDNWDQAKIQNYFDKHLTRLCSENNCKYNLKLTFRGMPFQAFDNPFTKHCIKAIKDVTGLEASQDTGGGTSDARFMQEVCPVFEFGTINKTLHKVNECVSVDDLKTTEKIYLKTLENFFHN